MRFKNNIIWWYWFATTDFIEQCRCQQCKKSAGSYRVKFRASGPFCDT